MIKSLILPQIYEWEAYLAEKYDSELECAFHYDYYGGMIEMLGVFKQMLDGVTVLPRKEGKKDVTD